MELNIEEITKMINKILELVCGNSEEGFLFTYQNQSYQDSITRC